MLRSDWCDYSDAYIVVKETIIVEGDNNAKKRNKKLTFKNNAPFRSCISKINNSFIDNAEDLDIVILMYNLLEHSRARNKGRSAVNDRRILRLDRRKSLICDQGDCPLFCNESCTQVNSDRWWKITWVTVYKMLIKCLQNNLFLPYFAYTK